MAEPLRRMEEGFGGGGSKRPLAGKYGDTTLVHVTTPVDHKGLSREKITFIAG